MSSAGFQPVTLMADPIGVQLRPPKPGEYLGDLVVAGPSTPRHRSGNLRRPAELRARILASS